MKKGGPDPGVRAWLELESGPQGAGTGFLSSGRPGASTMWPLRGLPEAWSVPEEVLCPLVACGPAAWTYFL